MPLPLSGQLSFADINTQLGNPTGTQLSFNDIAARNLCGIATGAVSLSDFYGKSTDPYSSNVVLLMHMDGTNGSKSFIDQKGHTVTYTNNPTISTTQSKFGGASLSCSDDRLEISNPADFVLSGDFTMEAWVYPTSTPWDLQPILGKWQTGTWTSCDFIWALNASAQPVFVWFPFSYSGFLLTGASVPFNSWQHVAVVKSGSAFYLFQNGILTVSAGCAIPLTATTTKLTIGSYYYSDGVSITNDGSGHDRAFKGYIDEIRVTKGIARYTSNFVVPNQPFPSQ